LRIIFDKNNKTVPTQIETTQITALKATLHYLSKLQASRQESEDWIFPFYKRWMKKAINS